MTATRDVGRAAKLTAMSREIALAVDKDGRIVWQDERTTRMFAGIDSLDFCAFAIPGTETKIKRLAEQASREPVARTELSLRVQGKPATFAFHGEPFDGGALLVGLHLGDEEVATFGALSDTVGELAEMHRQADRQRKELADSHRALVSMHAEIDDKNDALRRAFDVKSRVVSNVSHEFRTPINSILGITQLLLDRLDGDLSPEQETQLRFVRQSAEVLSDLVNDLLDLSRIEAGRHDLRVSHQSVPELFSSLRGMMKPIRRAPDVELIFDDVPSDVPAMETDHGKIAQILRNLISNAMKFTERGEIHVRVSALDPKRLRFEVSDTGIGIAPEDRERVFEEFSQIDSPLQRAVRGTGLGLSLSRKFAELLGGELHVTSKVGEGSTFVLDVPAVHEELRVVQTIVKKSESIDENRAQILVVEDNRQTLFLYERYLSNAGFQVIPARTTDEARRALERVKPAAIVLDVILEGEATWTFLQQLKEDPATRDIPVMVVTVIDRAQKARALGADEFWLKPIDGDRLIRKVSSMAKRGRSTHVLVVDDDEAARYLIKKLLPSPQFIVSEAATADEGVRQAQRGAPDVILLDFLLGAETAFDVLDDLKADITTRNIPVIIQTSKTLDDIERARLERETTSIVKKQSLSREVAIVRIREALEASGIRGNSASLIGSSDPLGGGST